MKTLSSGHIKNSYIDSVNSNPYALIGGGSKGIGYAIAEALAKRNFNLVLIARHKDSLIAAKNKLESKYGVHVETIQFDLAKKEAATEIATWCTDNNISLKVLCNVAGFGGFQRLFIPAA
jgi:short-subunit dehydrogenase